MRYIILNNSPEYPGGLERVIDRLLENFSSNFKKDLVIVCSESGKPKEFFWRDVKCFNLRVRRQLFCDRLFLFSRLVLSWRIYDFLKNVINDGDVVNIHGVEYALFLSVFRKRIDRIFRVIVTSHGSKFREYRDFVVRRLPLKFLPVKVLFFFILPYFWLVEFLAVYGADTIIFLTTASQNFYRAYYWIKKTVVIPNGVDGLSISSGESLHNPVRAFIIGSTYYGKGLDVAIKAVAAVNASGKKLELYVIGFPSLSPRYRPASVKYLGMMTRDRVKELIIQSDFLIFPSRFEASPLAVLESLSSGKPFIISAAAAEADLDLSKFGSILDDYSVEKWQAAIKKMTDPGVYENFTKAISRFDFSHLDWGRIAGLYEDVLK